MSIRIFAIFKKTIYISALEIFLRGKDIEVVATCSNSALALEQYNSLQVDMVLLDSSGYTLINPLRQINPGVKIIAVSSFFDPHSLSKLKELGVQGYFYQNMDNVLEQISECILKVYDGDTCYVTNYSAA